MKNNDSGKVTRRRFIGITAVLSFLSLAIPTSYFLTRKEKEMKISLASRKLVKGELDRIVAESNKLKKLYSKGVKWLDYMAQKISDKESFLDLSQDEKIEILKIADSGKSHFIYKVYLFVKYWKIRTAVEFFNTINRQTFEVFYTSDIGWKVVGYQGPPQWRGNLDYYKCS